MAHLFESQLLGGTVPLKNRIVMPPMTRTRTPEGGLPTRHGEVGYTDFPPCPIDSAARNAA
jgi:2,4-dienoyl-CoA reductase-like NADH-dependent reductase (Old Yellow Enzyme family)